MEEPSNRWNQKRVEFQLHEFVSYQRMRICGTPAAILVPSCSELVQLQLVYVREYGKCLLGHFSWEIWWPGNTFDDGGYTFKPKQAAESH